MDHAGQGKVYHPVTADHGQRSHRAGTGQIAQLVDVLSGINEA
ncbi:hypothetical protein SDC9_207895 [bioreactor metagenome]|uniref:Uncharacterized protein n=1 Tax=bioreactor metagenome TaxID=1076179 RepID=A0A645JAI5_9ZZZZ